jgi:hypothetical protein
MLEVLISQYIPRQTAVHMEHAMYCAQVALDKHIGNETVNTLREQNARQMPVTVLFSGWQMISTLLRVDCEACVCALRVVTYVPTGLLGEGQTVTQLALGPYRVAWVSLRPA